MPVLLFSCTERIDSYTEQKYSFKQSFSEIADEFIKSLK